MQDSLRNATQEDTMKKLLLAALACLAFLSCKPSDDERCAHEKCWSYQTLIPADATHCSVVCCLGEYGCREQFIPYVNKNTGQTEGMYDVHARKMTVLFTK